MIQGWPLTYFTIWSNLCPGCCGNTGRSCCFHQMSESWHMGLLFVFDGIIRRGEISKFQFMIFTELEVVTFSSQKALERANVSDIFSYLSVVFKLQQRLESRPYPGKSYETPVRTELLWSSKNWEQWYRISNMHTSKARIKWSTYVFRSVCN